MGTINTCSHTCTTLFYIANLSQGLSSNPGAPPIQRAIHPFLRYVSRLALLIRGLIPTYQQRGHSFTACKIQNGYHCSNVANRVWVIGRSILPENFVTKSKKMEIMEKINWGGDTAHSLLMWGHRTTLKEISLSTKFQVCSALPSDG